MASSLQQATQAAPSSGDGSAAGGVPNVSWKDLQYPPGSIGHRKPKPPPEEIDTEKQRDYLNKILSSKVYDVIVETPLQYAPILSCETKNKIWFKREDRQQIFSFKIRGAYNTISRLPKESLKKGVICASSGNHAQGVALSAMLLEGKAIVVMPLSTPKIKVLAVKRLGGDVELCGNGMADAIARAKERSEKEGLTLIPSVDSYIIAGTGTIGLEISRQMKDEIHAIFVPIGSGGLACGLASFYKLVFPKVLVFGVQPNDANAMAQALCRGEIVNVTDVGNFAEGVAIGQVSPEAFRICWELLDDVILVNEHLISAAIKDMFNDDRSILETSGALSIAAAKAYCNYYKLTGKNIVVVTSGANMDFKELPHISDLAYIDQSILATILPEGASLKDVMDQLPDHIDITETIYRFKHGSENMIVYKVRAVGSSLEDLVRHLNAAGHKTYIWSDSPIASQYFRYMVGGRADIGNENLFLFTFPEKKGALKHFLKGFQPNWKITLLFYRHQGIITADVLVGVQLDESRSNVESFHAYLKKVGYRYEKVNEDHSLNNFFKL